MVNAVSSRSECANMMDMFVSEYWKKEQALPTSKKSIFDEYFLAFLPVNDDRVVRYLKRRITMLNKVEDKLILYTEFINSGNDQLSSWSNVRATVRKLSTSLNENAQHDY